MFCSEINIVIIIILYEIFCTRDKKHIKKQTRVCPTQLGFSVLVQTLLSIVILNLIVYVSIVWLTSTHVCIMPNMCVLCRTCLFIHGWFAI